MINISDYKRLPGKSKRFINTKTGETVSRRQYDNAKSPGLSYEKKAQLNKLSMPEQSAVRPARGRKSAIKLEADARHIEAQKRIAESNKKQKQKLELKEQREIARKVERAKRKKIQSPKFSARLLQAGKKGRRVAFSYYSDYVTYLKDAKKSGIVFAISIGIEGVDVRTGDKLTAILYPMRDVNSSPISENDLEETVSDFLENKLYFAMTNMFLHIAFSQAYYEKKAKLVNQKTKPQIIRKKQSKK